MGKQSKEKWKKRLALQNSGEGNENQSGDGERNYVFKTGLEKTCLFIITWGAYAAMFVPLIIMTQFFFPFVAPKTTIFRIIVEIIFAAYLILVFVRGRYLPRINALTMALTIFLAVFILASLFGINISRSFWSTYERMTGIWTMMHLYAFFIILTATFKKRGNWEKILGMSVLAGIFLSLYILNGDEISTRGGGTIGNSSFMAAYLLFDIFFALILFLSNFLKKEGWPVFWQIFSGVGLLIMLPVLFNSSARAAVASFWAGIFLMGLCYLLFSGKKILKRAGFALVGVLIVLMGFALIFQPSPVKKGISGTLYEMESRFAVWDIGFESWKERPLLGWGPENFNTAFVKHFNPCMFTSCGGEIWFDRVHNIVLDTLVATGIFGLLSYLAIFGTAIFGLLKVIPKIAEKRNIFIPLGLVVILLSYFAQNFFVFDMINTYLVFFLTLAFIVFLISPQKEEAGSPQARRVHPLYIAAVIGSVIFFLWQGNIKPLSAGHEIIAAIISKDAGEAVGHFQKSLDSWMEKYEAREQFVQKMSEAVYQPIPQSMEREFFDALDLAEKEMENSVQENFLDFRPRLFLGRLYISSYRITGSPEKLSFARETLGKAIELSPTNMQGYWQLAEVMLAQKQGQEAVKLIQKSVELEPNFARSHWYLAMVYRINGDYQKAKEEVVRAGELGLGWDGSIENLKAVIEIYSALKDDAELLPLYLKAVDLAPGDANLWAGLAAIYANLGQFGKAGEAAREVIKIDPASKEKVEEFLKNFQ